MKTSRYSSSRQKSCDRCSSSKAKCDRRTPCKRCAKRGLPCVYTIPPSDPRKRPHEHLLHGRIAEETDRVHDRPSECSERGRVSIAFETNDARETSLTLDQLDLICPIDVEDISNRWLRPYIPGPDQVVKAYPAVVANYIWRILNSYAASACRGRGTLPFTHTALLASQAPNLPMATCLSLIRIAENPLSGTESVAAHVLQREMESIVSARETFDEVALLSAYQAYLVYTLVLFFRLKQGSSAFFRQAMMHLQELACMTCRQGLVCTAERLHLRPTWEEWIVAESKRRTLYIMYLLDSVLSAQERLPTFLATELRGLPAPSSKLLWHARTRSQWEKEYNLFLTEWTSSFFAIDELWPIRGGASEADITIREDRTNRWLENLDEYGVMFFAVTSYTHG